MMLRFGQALAMLNGFIAIAEHRDTDVAIYILVVWLLEGMIRVERAIKEAR